MNFKWIHWIQNQIQLYFKATYLYLRANTGALEHFDMLHWAIKLASFKKLIEKELQAIIKPTALQNREIPFLSHCSARITVVCDPFLILSHNTFSTSCHTFLATTTGCHWFKLPTTRLEYSLKGQPNPTGSILIQACTHPDTHDFFSLILHAMSVFTTCEYVTTPFWTMCTVLPSLYPIYPSLQQYQISSLSFLHFSELFGVILSLANPWTTMPQATYPKWFQVGTTLSCCQFLIPP